MLAALYGGLEFEANSNSDTNMLLEGSRVKRCVNGMYKMVHELGLNWQQAIEQQAIGNRQQAKVTLVRRN